jgi:hypothetical protein
MSTFEAVIEGMLFRNHLITYVLVFSTPFLFHQQWVSLVSKLERFVLLHRRFGMVHLCFFSSSTGSHSYQHGHLRVGVCRSPRVFPWSDRWCWYAFCVAFPRFPVGRLTPSGRGLPKGGGICHVGIQGHTHVNGFHVKLSTFSDCKVKLSYLLDNLNYSSAYTFYFTLERGWHCLAVI